MASRARSRGWWLIVVAWVWIPSVGLSRPSAAGGEAAPPGTLTYEGLEIPLQHVYLLEGPDSFEPDVTIRRLVFSAVDLGDALDGCAAMSCLADVLTEGVEVDLVAGRFHYWMAVNAARSQFSGTLDPAVLEPTADESERLAGTLRFDNSAIGGPKVDVAFDVKLAKRLTAAR